MIMIILRKNNYNFVEWNENLIISLSGRQQLLTSDNNGNKFSDRSMEVKLPDLLRNFDQPTGQPTDGQDLITIFCVQLLINV